MSLLKVENINAYYGGTQALFDVSLQLTQGSVLALLGRNGMGKSTTLRAILGLTPAQHGKISFDGQDIRTLAAHKIARMGIGYVPEGRRCFAGLNVRENLIAAARPGDWNLNTIGTLFPRLIERLNQDASALSGGEQQMLAIARALMTNPRLLILDEATEGLAPLVRQEIWSALQKLRQQTHLSIIVVDKSLRELQQIATNVTILERGRSVWQGDMSELDVNISNQYLAL